MTLELSYVLETHTLSWPRFRTVYIHQRQASPQSSRSLPQPKSQNKFHDGILISNLCKIVVWDIVYKVVHVKVIQGHVAIIDAQIWY